MYIDNILEISHDPKSIMEKIGILFDINNDQYGPSTRYLGSDVENSNCQAECRIGV